MKIEELRLLSEKGEDEYNLNSDEDLLSVPSPNHKTGMEFVLEDVLECFNKPAHLRDTVFLVGGTAIRGKGNDVDIVIRGDDFSEEIKESLDFRLYRAFANYFNIEYDSVSKYLHISYTGAGGSFTDFVSLYNFSIVPTKNEERTIRRMSLDDVDFDKFEILEKSNRRIIAGTASTDSIDLSGEKITKEALTNIWKHIEKMPDEFLNCMLGHSSTQAGKILKSYRNRKSALLDNSIYVICELRKDLPIIDKVWEEITSDKEKFGFSIKINIPKPSKKNIKKICDEDKCWTEILDAKFIEISLTESPANTDCSDLQVLSK